VGFRAIGGAYFSEFAEITTVPVRYASRRDQVIGIWFGVGDPNRLKDSQEEPFE